MPDAEGALSICSVAELTAEPVIVARRALCVGRLRCWLYTLLTGLRVLRGMSSSVGFHPPQLITRVKSVLLMAADPGRRGLSVRAGAPAACGPGVTPRAGAHTEGPAAPLSFPAPPGAAPDFQQLWRSSRDIGNGILKRRLIGRGSSSTLKIYKP